MCLLLTYVGFIYPSMKFEELVFRGSFKSSFLLFWLPIYTSLHCHLHEPPFLTMGCHSVATMQSKITNTLAYDYRETFPQFTVHMFSSDIWTFFYIKISTADILLLEPEDMTPTVLNKN